MKFILLLCLLLVTFGFRHQSSHKSQYDLGYEAGLRDAAQEQDLAKELDLDEQYSWCWFGRIPYRC